MSRIDKSALAVLKLGSSTERRAVRRKATEFAVTVTAPDGSFQTEMRDLSVQGCSLNYAKGAPRLGQIIKLEVTDTEALAGIIRWVRDRTVGVEFLRAIPPSHALYATLSA